MTAVADGAELLDVLCGVVLKPTGTELDIRVATHELGDVTAPGCRVPWEMCDDRVAVDAHEHALRQGVEQAGDTSRLANRSMAQ